MSVIMRHPHQACRESPTTLPSQTAKMMPCSCCPYGYHIDLDFLRYCETLANVVPSDGELKRRDRRRQRKSMEVMLGFEQIIQLQQITPVIEETTPDFETSSPNWSQLSNGYKETQNNTRARSEFVRDALEDVCDDFERTLERTKSKRRGQRSYSDNYDFGDRFDEIDMTMYDNVDACITSNKHYNHNGAYEKHTKPVSPVYQKPNRDFKTLVELSPTHSIPSNRETDRESIASNGSEVSTGALQNIREQMALSLKRMRDLEEQVKIVPVLQQQLLTIKKEKEQLEQRVKEEEIRRANTVSPPKNTTTPLTKPFHSQRHSPISLDSLNVKLQPPYATTSQPTTGKSSPPQTTESSPVPPIQKRDASQMTTMSLTREVGITTNQIKTRTTAVNTDQKSYTKQELQAAIDLTIERQQLEQFHAQQKKLISVGTQMQPVAIPQKQLASVGQQTQNESQTISTQTRTNQKSVEIACHPQTRSIGISDHSTVEELCPTCSIEKRTIGCGPDEEPSMISLKLMDMAPPKRSLTFSLGDGEKLNISRKSVGTQYSCIGPTKIDSSTQHFAPLMRDKHCQQSGPTTCNQMNDTNGLIQIKSQSCATDPIHQIKKFNAESNTEPQKLDNVSTNTDPPPMRLDHSTNTIKTPSKDAACGGTVKPHISISCADNYCDTCKDSIMNLAKGFVKHTNGVSVPSAVLPTTEASRIPRPMALMSPRTERKFVRQNTYTVPSTEGSPIEQQMCPAEMFLRLSALDSSSTNKSKSEQLHNEQAVKNDETNLPTTLTELPGLSQAQLNRVSVEGQTNSENVVALSENSTLTASEFLELGCNDEGLIVVQTDVTTKEENTTEVARTKAVPNKEVLAALKVINDSLQKTNNYETNLKNANRIVQREWFRLSSTDTANPLDVEDYLDCFEEFSTNLLKYMVNLADTNGNTAMHYSVSHANFDIVSILLDSKVCNVNQTNNAGYTCVMLVSLAKLKLSAHHTVVKRLFQMSDVNIRAKKHNQTALMLAVSHGNLDMVQMLLDAGADINIQDEDGSTALMCAAEHGRIDIVKLLLAQSECDSCITDIDGSTALKISLDAGHRDIGVLLYAHEHITRGKTSPYTSLRRKKKQSALSRPTSVSTPASPAPSTKFHHHNK
ncbi:uncharacterized protein LOC119080396 isoform X1 [Bradysia coprophila]|uniref:uncharacterized protein LOC119080396 isoform X1 n=1 Tax=Bradysia coprophila TaxID=38358 RepID=UPI00187DD6D7|nr:uncharacterized protein LOC119080396 isoform X1 [Bradysia coprophila]XP_037044611.1 uncharacterized protein LOC119080396 isoform X1 [Bradysia coprophila]XP_037044612.1 uncharacterized protein LOC119080396 isoform X1 [Bradysia coprophila]